MTVTQFLVTVLLVAIPYLLIGMPLLEMWNKHSRLDAVGFVALIVLATLLWQGAWHMAGGVV